MEMKEKVERLSQLRHLRREVNDLSQRIAELELAAQGGVGHVTGLPWGKARRDRVGDMAAKLADLRDVLDARRTRCMELLGELYAFIDDIDDSLTRQIMTYRYIDGDSWQVVARRIGESDEQYPRRIHNRYLLGRQCPLPQADAPNGTNSGAQ